MERVQLGLPCIQLVLCTIKVMPPNLQVNPLKTSPEYIRRFIDQSACHNAVRSLVLSRIDYCNGLLSSIPSTQLDRVQRLQNWVARLVFQVSRDHPSQPLLNSLHWLPLKQRTYLNYSCLAIKSSTIKLQNI